MQAQPAEKTEKVIFQQFGHELELIKKEILAYARMKSGDADEIFGSASDEINSVLPPSRRISSPSGDFIIEDDFTRPQGWL